MKTLKNFNEALKEIAQFAMQDDVIKNIDIDELKNYVKAASKFLSADTKLFLGYLIDLGDDYAKKFDKGSSKAVYEFTMGNPPSDAEGRKAFAAARKVVKVGRELEIPFFQTQEQFDGIVSKTIAPDEILLDLVTEKGRNEVAKKFDALCWKIAREYMGKGPFTLEELHSSAQAGLTWAMNDYGKKTSKNTDQTGVKIKSTTFLEFASSRIRFEIIGMLRTDSHLIRVPISQQSKNKKEIGKFSDVGTVSLDSPYGTSKDGKEKTLADVIPDYERGGKEMDYKDIDASWKRFQDVLADNFDEKTLDVFYSSQGLFGHKKVKGAVLMDKYGFKNQSNINAINTKVIKFIRSDKKLMSMLTDLYQEIQEVKHDDDLENRDYEPVYLSSISDDIIDENED